MAASTKKSNTGTIVAAVIGTLIYAAATWAVVDKAGGTDAEDSSYSNTPNGVTPGAPGTVPSESPYAE